MREKSIKAPVEDSGGDEGVKIADVETAQVETLAWLRLSYARRWLAASRRESSLQVLTTQGDAGRFITGCNDVVDKAGQRGDAADNEGGDGAPVTTISGRVAVDAVEIVHVGYGHVTASDDVVAAARQKRISGYGRGRWGLWHCGGRTRLSKWMSWDPGKWCSR